MKFRTHLVCEGKTDFYSFLVFSEFLVFHGYAAGFVIVSKCFFFQFPIIICFWFYTAQVTAGPPILHPPYAGVFLPNQLKKISKTGRLLHFGQPLWLAFGLLRND